MSQTDELLRALAKISEIANVASSGCENCRHSDGASLAGVPGCVIKSLPVRLQAKSAETAARINPINAPIIWPITAGIVGASVSEPQRIAVMTSKYWGPTPRQFTVSFMETIPNDLKTKIIHNMNAWTKTAGISFVGTNGTGNVRISRGAGGYWSYLGTDILHIPANRQTMNLEGFSLTTPDSEYKRVVRHETGHTLGFPHEHMRTEIVARIDHAKAYDWFWRTYRWDKATVDAQVLTPLSESSIIGTPTDQTSIMCYQLPASITKDGKPIVGGTDINATDYGFAGKIYPKLTHAVFGHAITHSDDDDWELSEDVEVSDVSF